MEGKERRDQIIEILKSSEEPLSGTALAERLAVSRQVIVQDIALLRAVDKNILSTNKGYLLFMPDRKKRNRIFHVKHRDESIEEELNIIVDNGGRILDVVIEHYIYGQITADLRISTRRDVAEFLEKLRSGKARPLSLLTNGEHYHTVEADKESQLELIEQALAKAGLLLTER